MTLLQSFLLLASLPFFPAAEAHPGHDLAPEIEFRSSYMNSAPMHKRSLAHCQEKLNANREKMAKRRLDLAEKLRAKRSIGRTGPYLKARDVDDVLSTSHRSNETDLTADTDPAELFGDDNACILTPDVDEGPFYVSGELVREDVTDEQKGIAVTMDFQVIDMNTCEPYPDLYLEIWYCNSTGVYSGVVAEGNGDGLEDTANYDATHGRGIQQTDSDGIATFNSIFPGHYLFRTTHTHVLARVDATLHPNNTISGGRLPYSGQLFYDQELIDEVAKVEPYSTNEKDVTLNKDDDWLLGEAETFDPIFKYVYLGESVEDGLLQWITLGVDSGRDVDVSVAAFYSEDGGIPLGESPPADSTDSENGTEPTSTSSESGDATGDASASSTSNVATYGRGTDVLSGLWASLLALLAFAI